MRALGLLALVLAAWTSTALAQDAGSTDIVGLVEGLPGERAIINAPTIDAYEAHGEHARSRVVEAGEVVGGEALRVTVRKPGPDPWSVEVKARLTGEVAEGDVVFVAFLARAIEADNEAQNGVVSTFSVQQDGGSYVPVAQASALVPLGSWRMYSGWGRAGVPLTPETGMIGIHLGATAQVIDIGPAVVVNLGPDVNTDALPRPRLDYQGREEGASWRAEAEARIAEHRVSPLTVEVVDANGAPAEGASVRARMTRSAFGFGTFVGHDVAGRQGGDGEAFREAVRGSFNLATSPLYWAEWGWLDEDVRQDYLASMAWLRDQGIPFRGHPIIWPVERFVPPHVQAMSPGAQAREAVLAHVREVVTVARAYGPVAYDAYNEPHVGDYLPGRAGADIAEEVFTLAHEIDPDATLFVNDYGMLSGGGMNEENLGLYEGWIRDHLDRGVPVGGIGFQGHFGAALTHPARIVEVLERFSAFGLPIQVTEFDVDTKDEAAQADYLRDALLAAYSVPAVDAFVVWGFWEGDHWRPDGAMIREDWTPKPAWGVWNDAQARWRTDETMRTGEDGTASVPGHHGDYAVEVTGEDGQARTARVTLPPGGATVRVVLD